jgi:hypothetical protein
MWYDLEELQGGGVIDLRYVGTPSRSNRIDHPWGGSDTGGKLMQDHLYIGRSVVRNGMSILEILTP